MTEKGTDKWRKSGRLSLDMAARAGKHILMDKLSFPVDDTLYQKMLKAKEEDEKALT